jgi:hypothetical protein
MYLSSANGALYLLAWGSAPGIHVIRQTLALKARFIPANRGAINGEPVG